MAGINFMKPRAESIKENARPKPRVFAEFAKIIHKSSEQNKGIKKKQISSEKLEQVKNKIREKTAKTQRKKLIFRLLLVAVLLVSTFFIAKKFYKSIEKGRLITEKKLEDAYAWKQKLIIEGFQQLKVGQFFRAKTKFLNAAKVDPDDYLLQLGLTTSYVKLCKHYDYGCDKVNNALNNLQSQYGITPEIEKLTIEYKEMQKEK